MQLLRITARLEGQVRARGWKLFGNCTDVLANTFALSAGCNTQNEDCQNEILTSGQSKVKLAVDASVASSVATAASHVSPIVQYTRQGVLTGDVVHLEVATKSAQRSSPSRCRSCLRSR